MNPRLARRNLTMTVNVIRFYCLMSIVKMHLGVRGKFLTEVLFLKCRSLFNSHCMDTFDIRNWS